MEMLVKFIRNALGLVIVIGDVLTRWSRVKRSPDAQEATDKACQSMALYHFFGCPFCVKVRRTIYKLNLPINKKSASEGSQYRHELIAGGGKVQVPCLRIQNPDGSEQWMYESKQINAYLRERFANYQ
ncbi:MAG: glutathione S-transferase N-terminal domain-containing protein [Alteromonadaceae bacterium]|nr:glutathione S-transferase N-terminal domain-containing protein [Alteromonadaceae bacterium]